jgi:hypothetical protein
MWEPRPAAGLRRHDASPLIYKVRQRRAPPDVPEQSTGHLRGATPPAVTSAAQDARPLRTEVFQHAFSKRRRAALLSTMTRTAVPIPAGRFSRSQHSFNGHPTP